MGIQESDLAELKRGISILFATGDVVEVRIPKTRFGVVSGYFDDHQLLATSIFDADLRYKAPGVYYVLNRIDPALLGRAYNRLKERVEYTTGDDFDDYEGWLEFSNPESRNRVCQRRHPLQCRVHSGASVYPIRRGAIAAGGASTLARYERTSRESCLSSPFWGAVR